MIIAGRKIDRDHEPYVVAEISASHRGKLENALKLVQAAKEAGASAVKFQCFLPETITVDSDLPQFTIQEGPWRGRRLFELYTEAHTPREWFPRLFGYAKEIGIAAFSTACSIEDVEFLEQFDPPAYKVASFDIQNHDLIKRMARTGKPVIISAGMASDPDIWESALTAREGGLPGSQIAMLHCVSAYPHSLQQASLRSLRRLDNGLTGNSGYSDHTRSHESAVMAVALGAVILEKHITLDEAGGGLDDGFAIDPIQFRRYVHFVKRAWQAMQPPSDTSGEDAHRKLRPSIHAIKDIAAGEAFTRENIRAVRPSGGLEPFHMQHLVGGKKAAHPVSRGTPITWREVEANSKELAA
jgi:N-acetylneuraminate synthase